jgi:hypothetical protein
VVGRGADIYAIDCGPEQEAVNTRTNLESNSKWVIQLKISPNRPVPLLHSQQQQRLGSLPAFAVAKILPESGLTD